MLQVYEYSLIIENPSGDNNIAPVIIHLIHY